MEDDLDLKSLLSNFAQGKKDKLYLISEQLKVTALFEKDSEVQIVSNRHGELCPTYPPDIVIPVGDATHQRFRALIRSGRYARVHARFPVPILRVYGNYLCRSSTIARGAECIFRNIYHWMFGDDKMDKVSLDVTSQRKSDAMLLAEYGVVHIVDLMVEGKKKHFGVTVCSSEKASVRAAGIYSGLVEVMPFPGCEYFRDEGRDIRGWDQDAEFSVSDPGLLSRVENADFREYKEWNMYELARNYYLIILQMLRNGGVLLHCISGWDRTPFFVCLMRVSLWADGLCHTSLSAHEMLFLTVAYDWMLFQHQFPSRLRSGYEVMLVTFRVLQTMGGEEYAAYGQTGDRRRMSRMDEICGLFFDTYTNVIDRESMTNV